MMLRSGIIIIATILICLYFANIEMESQKEEGFLESTLYTPINDNFDEVGFESQFSTVPMMWSLPHING